MISLFLPSLYADHLSVPLSAISQVTSAVQIFDAATDPVLGYVSAAWVDGWVHWWIQVPNPLGKMGEIGLSTIQNWGKMGGH